MTVRRWIHPHDPTGQTVVVDDLDADGNLVATHNERGREPRSPSPPPFRYPYSTRERKPS